VFYLLSVLVAALSTTTAAQPLARHALHTIPVVPEELLQRPIPIRKGIGSIHQAVTTKSAEAQAYYDQGLTYLHSYVWIEAARSFNQALRLDGQIALAQAGLSIALTELNLSPQAHQALDRARALAPRLPPRERSLVEIRQAQMAAEDAPRDASKLAAYRAALDRAITEFPDEDELLLLRGVAEAPEASDRGQGATAASIPFFQRVLARKPDHAAAHHYLTHAFENTSRTAEALTHARAFAKQAPNVAHARHMLAHELRRAGQIDEAIAEFEAADRLEREYSTSEMVPAAYDWHHHHNLDLLASSYQYTGQMKKAEALFRESFGLPSNLVAQLFNKREWPLFLRSRGRIDESVEAARILAAHPHPLIQAVGHIEAGYGLLAAKQYAAAGAESDAALKLLRAGAEGGPMAASALAGLQGEYFLRTAARAKGRQALEDAANRWRATAGPDGWVQALFRLEAMFAAARDVGDWELAASLAKLMMDHDPRYAGSHLGAGLVAEHAADLPAARAAFAQAAKLWAKADPDLPELALIRSKK
jgi:tetratricopeptide (TPR) repeat protein